MKELYLTSCQMSRRKRSTIGLGHTFAQWPLDPRDIVMSTVIEFLDTRVHKLLGLVSRHACRHWHDTEHCQVRSNTWHHDYPTGNTIPGCPCLDALAFTLTTTNFIFFESLTIYCEMSISRRPSMTSAAVQAATRALSNSTRSLCKHISTLSNCPT